MSIVATTLRSGEILITRPSISSASISRRESDDVINVEPESLLETRPLFETRA